MPPSSKRSGPLNLSSVMCGRASCVRGGAADTSGGMPELSRRPCRPRLTFGQWLISCSPSLVKEKTGSR